MVQEVIRHEDEFYILASSPRVDDRTRVLKEGETFAVVDRHGDIDPYGGGELGLYHDGTRFLSRLTLSVFDRRPLLLSSTVKQGNDLLAVDLTNQDVSTPEGLVPHGVVHLFRSMFLWSGVCHGRLRVRNFGLEPIRIPVALQFDSDFADIFEVRGMRRKRRGERLEVAPSGAESVLAYRGLDGRARRSAISWAPAPDELTPREARWHLSLDPKEEVAICFRVACEAEPSARRDSVPAYEVAFQEAGRSLEALSFRAARVVTSNHQFNQWLNRSRSDLDMMTTATEHGLYPYAGVPWFSTVFGRDGIITAFETLWLNPEIARGVLGVLSATQADATVPEQDAEPGKILHEMRRGEMAALGEIPFGRYYGTVDATPLFVMLAAAYGRWTGDMDFVRQHWGNIERALAWIDELGDVDGDGFVEYARKSSHGLSNQGWKDSHDAVFHSDGRLAEPPIALVEVQAYVYAAKRGASGLAAALGDEAGAERLAGEADALRKRFEDVFWCEELGTYALALDGDKRPCRVRASNAGHCLFAGIAAPDRAERVARALFTDQSFSGWGLRTLASGEARYNPMSYHNGSVWPHDNALVAAGLARYGFKAELLELMGALYEASLFVDLNRLPELVCGFVRRPEEGPTLYPLACAPQAWAAAAPFSLLQSCLGMEVDGAGGQVKFYRPLLPKFLDWVEIRNLRVGASTIDVRFVSYPHDSGLEVLRRDADVEVLVSK